MNCIFLKKGKKEKCQRTINAYITKNILPLKNITFNQKPLFIWKYIKLNLINHRISLFVVVVVIIATTTYVLIYDTKLQDILTIVVSFFQRYLL